MFLYCQLRDAGLRLPGLGTIGYTYHIILNPRVLVDFGAQFSTRKIAFSYHFMHTNACFLCAMQLGKKHYAASTQAWNHKKLATNLLVHPGFW